MVFGVRVKADSAIQEILVKGAKKLDVHLDEDALQRLQLYFIELQRWSKKINLIARGSSTQTILENHFLDSLTLLPLLKGSQIHLLDVGTGAGFPGLVCGAVRTSISITLVEPRLKRVSFLRHIVRTLAMENVEVHADRLENLDFNSSHTHFTHITSRAVTDIASFLVMIDRLLHDDTSVICMKAAKWREETKGLEDILQSFALEVSHEKLFSLPFSGAKRALLVYQKKINDLNL